MAIDNHWTKARNVDQTYLQTSISAYISYRRLRGLPRVFWPPWKLTTDQWGVFSLAPAACMIVEIFKLGKLSTFDVS
jgi:hypothetical protein